MIKWIIKWALRLLIAAVAVVVLLVIFKDAIARAVTEHHIRAETGMDVRIGRIRTSVTSPTVRLTIEDFRIYNPADFGGTLFVDVPELHLECDRNAFAKGQIRITLMRFNLSEVSIVRNELGQTNVVNMLHKAKLQLPRDKKKSRTSAYGYDFASIDVLNVSVGKIKHIDLRDPSNNRERAVDLQNQIFNNVKSEADLSGVLTLLWLRSGGAFTITPTELVQRYAERRSSRAPTASPSNTPVQQRN